jgi:hypothetical protein
MSQLRFSDGITVDTSGQPRVLHLEDGYYAVGKGILVPATNKETAEFLVMRMIGWEPGENIIKSRINKVDLQHKK